MSASEPVAIATATPTTPVAGRFALLLNRGRPWLYFTVCLLGICLVWMILRQSHNVDRLSRELAQRSAANQALAQAADQRATEALATLRSLNDRLTVLDGRLNESRGQQAALEKLYQDLLRGQDDWVMIEVDQTLTIASQQLVLAGNVSSAIAALQVADTRLARNDHPQFLPVRRAIAKDLERLRALPAIDLAGAVLRIDELGHLLESVPVVSELSLKTPKTSSPAPRTDQSTQWSWLGIHIHWQAIKTAVVDELRNLVRVRVVRDGSALLMTPEQVMGWREHLKLRLLNARLALLSRQEAIYRRDIEAVQIGLNQQAEPQALATQSAQRLLRQLAAVAVAVDLPSLNDSLAALRALRYRQDNAPR